MMSDKTPPTSKDELKTELQALLCGAYDNGVALKGGFAYRNGDEYPDWDVIVTEVEKQGQSGESR